MANWQRAAADRRTVAWCLAVLAMQALTSHGAAAETLIQRGDYLVNGIMSCGNCHTPKDASGNAIAGKELSGGGLSFAAPAFAVTASNITQDRDTGIGTWSDAELKRALTEGVRPDHGALARVPLAPPMLVNFNKALTPRDLDAVVAYLRTVPPVRNEVAAPIYKKPFGRAPYPDAEKSYTEAALQDPITRGAYLATIGHCMACHSTFAKGQPDYVDGLGRGGRQFEPSEIGGLPSTWQGAVARNITSHPTSGVGAWSDAELKRAITHGIERNGQALAPPMAFAWYARLSDADLDALVAWLRTVPARE